LGARWSEEKGCRTHARSPSLLTLSSQDALQEAATAVHELSQQFNQRSFERKVSDAIRQTSSLLDECTYMLSHSRFDDALTKFAQSRAAAVDLTALTSPAATEYLKTYEEKAKEFQTTFDATMLARRRSDHTRVITDALSNVKQLFAHYRNEECLAAMRTTRDEVDSFAAEFATAEDAAKVAAW
jgi:hypothetical protein